MLGEVENNLDFIASLDLVVSTSFVEGISLTAMEAIQLGVPVVAPRIGGMSELIKNGHNGYLYDVDDFNSLKSIVEFIFESPEVLKNLQKTTKEMGLPKQFEAESMITSYLKLLN
jgi:glycosyltransferase involved in cell wall biosynthesis